MSNLSSLVAVVLLANIVGQQGLPRRRLVAVAVDFHEVLLFEVSSKFERSEEEVECYYPSFFRSSVPKTNLSGLI